VDDRPDIEQDNWTSQLAQPAGDDQQAALLERLEALREGVASLEKQISRTGREQFKANVAAEAQAAQLSAALEMLRAADERREAELAAQRERSQAAQAEARLEIIRAILPALDGLDEALHSGRQVLVQHISPPPAPSPPPTPAREGQSWTLIRRLRGLFATPPPQAAPSEPQADQPPDAALHAALESWLVGLGFVRRRLLELLAAQGVFPMDAEGAPFDPRYHIAVEIAPSGLGRAPGTVVQELRRGYTVGERVLRHAEVAVTRDT
jgi:molecular chaperone GrpE (heat shock protein)